MTDTFPLTDAQVLAFADGDESIAEDNHEALFDYYASSDRGDDAMPYGTAKARTGDPYHFIAEKLAQRAVVIRFYTDTGHQSVMAFMEKRGAR